MGDNIMEEFCKDCKIFEKWQLWALAEIEYYNNKLWSYCKRKHFTDKQIKQIYGGSK